MFDTPITRSEVPGRFEPQSLSPSVLFLLTTKGTANTPTPLLTGSLESPENTTFRPPLRNRENPHKHWVCMQLKT